MIKETKTDRAFNEGYEEGYKVQKDLSALDFSRLCYLLSEDSTIDHEQAGILIYKLHEKVDLGRISKNA